MPIRSLESFLFERKLVSTSSIEILANATVGIDVEHYLSRVYTFKKEQLLFAIGGVPASLVDYIQSDLRVFDEFNIRPLFVLPGLRVEAYRVASSINGASPQEEHLAATWNKLNPKANSHRGVPPSFPSQSFRLHTDPLPVRPMFNDLLHYFIDNNIDYMICPFDASFQLSYLYQSGAIDTIYGSTDLLLTEVDRFVLGMEFQSKEFRFVDKQRALSELGLSNRLLIDISIIVGCSAQPETFSHLPPSPKATALSPYNQFGYFRWVLDVVYQTQAYYGQLPDLFGYVSSLNDPAMNDLYLRGLATIQYMPVLAASGSAELYFLAVKNLHNQRVNEHSTDDGSASEQNVISHPDIPSSIHSVVSQRLPPELFFYQSIGLLPLTVIESLTLGEIYIGPPLESGHSESYRTLVTSAFFRRGIERQIVMLSKIMNRYYQVKQIKLRYWFTDVQDEINLKLMAANLNPIPQYGDSSEDEFVFSELIENKNAVQLSTGLGLRNRLALALERALTFLVSGADQITVSKIKKILVSFVDKNPDVEAVSLQKLLVFLLFFVVTDYDLFKLDAVFPSVPQVYKPVELPPLTSGESQLISLISRVMSLCKMSIRPINYQGPISRSLLSFRSHFKILYELIGCSCQVALIEDLVKKSDFGLSTQNRSDWYAVISKLPFYEDVSNTLTGVFAEIYFDLCIRYCKSGTSPLASKELGREHLLGHVLQVANSSHNINLNSVNSVSEGRFIADLSHGVQFWKLFGKFIHEVHLQDQSIVSEDQIKLFEDADTLVEQFW